MAQTYTEMMCSQKDPLWWQTRNGLLLTCSDFGTVTGNNPYKTVEVLLYEKMNRIKTKTNSFMQHGIDTEPKARAWYEKKTGNKVRESGIVIPTWNKLIGGSVDGFVDPDGMIEIKCPNKMYNFTVGPDNPFGMPSSHWDQVQGYLFICKKLWCDYIVYKEPQVIVKRILPNELYWKKVLYPKIMSFLDKLLNPRPQGTISQVPVQQITYSKRPKTSESEVVETLPVVVDEQPVQLVETVQAIEVVESVTEPCQVE